MILKYMYLYFTEPPCEVLSTLTSYPLPATIIINPWGYWKLQFELQAEDSLNTMCIVIVQEKNEKFLTYTLYHGHCYSDTFKVYHDNYAFIRTFYWIKLKVEVIENNIHITYPDETSIGLPIDEMYKPARFQILDGTIPSSSLRIVEISNAHAAVGCKVNCPNYNIASRKGEQSKVLNSLDKYIWFFFKKKSHFSKLNVEVKCLNPLGSIKIVSVTNIHNFHIPWGLVLVELNRYNNNTIAVIVNDVVVKTKHIKHCEIIIQTVKIEGDGNFNFYCNPKYGLVTKHKWEKYNFGISNMTFSYNNLILLVMVTSLSIFFTLFTHVTFQ